MTEKFEQGHSVFTTKNYLAYQENIELRKQSQSGGVSLTLALETLKQDGVVYGCCYNSILEAYHRRISDKSEIMLTCGSKYVQSDIGDTYHSTYQDLKHNKKVLFTGTSCQIDGLLNYLILKKVNIDNLITVDLICHGVSSPKILREYIEYLSKENGQRVVSINMRNKKYAPINISTFELEDGTEMANNGFTDLFYSNLILRPSCGECRYCRRNKPSDITLGDVVQISERLSNHIDPKDPKSIVIVRSPKGMKLLIESGVNLLEINHDDFDQVNLREPTKISPQRTIFWQNYNNNGIAFVLKKYTCLGGMLTKIRRKIMQKRGTW